MDKVFTIYDSADLDRETWRITESQFAQANPDDAEGLAAMGALAVGESTMLGMGFVVTRES